MTNQTGDLLVDFVFVMFGVLLHFTRRYEFRKS